MGRLVDKLAEATQDSWFQYLAKHPKQVEHESFEEWLEVDRNVAIKHRMKTIAAG